MGSRAAVPSRRTALRPLIPERRLRARVRALGRRIRRDAGTRVLHAVGVLDGAFLFMADLVRAVGPPLTCDFLSVSSYGSGTETTGRVRIRKGPSVPLRGRHVLLVEDIVDTGLTLRSVLAALKRRRPASVNVCTLLRKRGRERVRVRVDYVGFEIPDRFVVGYGLDLDGRHRELPYVAEASWRTP